MDINTFILPTLEFALIVSFLAFFFERILILTGLTRGNTIILVLGIFGASILKQFVDPHDSYIALGFFIIFAGTMAANRYDLTKTLQKGRWWWRKENENNSS